MVRGVEACLWTEFVPTEARVEQMLYPRLFALSEVGWSSHGDTGEFLSRAGVLNHRIEKAGYAAFSLDGEVGQRKEYNIPVKALSVGKPVKYNIPYSQSYVAGGDGALTDGLRGGWTYADRRWQGFIKGGRLDVVVDLLEPTQIHNVAADFLQVVGADVYVPASIEVLVSDNGVDFRSVDTASWAVGKEEPFKISSYKWQGSERARYVRVKANCSGTLGGWVFTDEIVIE